MAKKDTDDLPWAISPHSCRLVLAEPSWVLARAREEGYDDDEDDDGQGKDRPEFRRGCPFKWGSVEITEHWRPGSDSYFTITLAGPFDAFLTSTADGRDDFYDGLYVEKVDHKFPSLEAVEDMALTYFGYRDVAVRKAIIEESDEVDRFYDAIDTIAKSNGKIRMVTFQTIDEDELGDEDREMEEDED